MFLESASLDKRHKTSLGWPSFFFYNSGQNWGCQKAVCSPCGCTMKGIESPGQHLDQKVKQQSDIKDQMKVEVVLFQTATCKLVEIITKIHNPRLFVLLPPSIIHSCLDICQPGANFNQLVSSFLKVIIVIVAGDSSRKLAVWLSLARIKAHNQLLRQNNSWTCLSVSFSFSCLVVACSMMSI